MAKQCTNTELIILGLISEQPRYGYEVEQLIQERCIRNWLPLGFSSIYYVLNKLEQGGLISQTLLQDSETRKIYKITGPGRLLCAAAAEQALQEARPGSTTFLVGLANSPTLLPEASVRSLQERNRWLQKQLGEAQLARQVHNDAPDMVHALFNYNLSLIEAERTWLAQTIAQLQTIMDKLDLKKELKELYSPTTKDFSVVVVPAMQYAMIDGEGDPNIAESYKQAVEALYAVAYAIKFASKRGLGKDYGVMPLERLWTAADMTAFTARDKAGWKWTMMIMQPSWITQHIFAQAIETVRAKKNPAALSLIRFETYDEGESVQIMHIGSYDDEAPTLHRLHTEYLPANGYTPTGRHHEIYLGDPRKTDPGKLKTVLRQPVKKVS